MSFDGWLDARDSATVEREWATLGAKRVAIGQFEPYLSVDPHGAALLAAAFLECSPDRFAWWTIERWVQPSPWPAPTVTANHVVSRSFLDEEHRVDQPECYESWQIRETIEGTRGVQHITIDCSWGPMTREGGEGRSSTIVRIFDRSTQRAVSMPLYSTSVWMVGDIDLSPLDLFSHRLSYQLPWKTLDVAAARGLITQIVGAPWDGEITDEETLIFVRVRGLPWGHEIDLRIAKCDDGVDGWIDFRLPRAQLDAAIARAKLLGI